MKKYLIKYHLQLIAIVLMIFLVYVEHLIYDEIKAKSILKPIIVLDTMRDKDKEAPELTEGVTIYKSGLHGFRVNWEKEGWRAVNWKLRRTNFEDKDRYLLLFKGKATKEGKITLTLVDDNKHYINLPPISVHEHITEETYHLGSIKECYIQEEVNNISVQKIMDSKLFNWKCIKGIQLSRYYEEKEENEITFNKLIILWLDYEVQ